MNLRIDFSSFGLDAPSWLSRGRPDTRMIVCHCFARTDHDIRKAVREGNLRTPQEVTRGCLAGGGCGGCAPLIEAIMVQEGLLRQSGQEPVGEPSTTAA